jgi:hypothetical protein
MQIIWVVPYWPHVNSPVPKKNLLNANHMGTLLASHPQKIVKCKSYGVPYWLHVLHSPLPAKFHPPKQLNVNHEFWHLMFVCSSVRGTLHSCGIYNSDIG